MSFSDFDSDLTDLSSDDDYAAPSQPKKKATPKKTMKRAGYTIPQALRPPRATQYSVKSLYEQIVDSSINLDPEYQRDVVWPDTKQVGLIDSVFRNYYVPPVIFAVSTAEDGTETRVCIDGKQRLTSLQRFMDGEIPYRDSVTNKKYWFKRNGPGAKTMLPTPLMASFANKQIVCVEYDNLDDDQEREIFQRVQLGVALTPAERMQAITGPWPTFIRELQSQVVGDDGFGEALDWGRARGRDFQGLVSIVFVIDKLPTFTTPVSPALDKWLVRTTSVPQKLRNEVFETFRIFLKLVKDKKYNNAFHKPTRVSPIEFVMIGVLIYTRRNKLSLMQMASAIEKMRADVRTREKDVRTNTRVSKALLKFITDKVDKLDLKSDGKGDKSAASAVAVSPSPLPPVGKKRKRVESSDVDDQSEDEVRPPTRKVAVSAAIPKATKTAPKQTSKAQVSTSKATPSKPVTSKATSSQVTTKVATPRATTTKASVPSTSRKLVASTKASSTNGQAKSNSQTNRLSDSSGAALKSSLSYGTFSRPKLPPVNTQLPTPAPAGPSTSSSQRPIPSQNQPVSSPSLPPNSRPASTLPSSALSNAVPSPSPASMQPPSAGATQSPVIRTPTIPFIKNEPDTEGMPRPNRLAAIRAARAAANGQVSPVMATPSTPQLPNIPPAPVHNNGPMGQPSQPSPMSRILQSNVASQPQFQPQPQPPPPGPGNQQPVSATQPTAVPLPTPSTAPTALGGIDVGSLEAILRASGYNANNPPPPGAFGQQTSPNTIPYGISNIPKQMQMSPQTTAQQYSAAQSPVQIPPNLQSILQNANGLPNNVHSLPPRPPSHGDIVPKREYLEPSLSRVGSRSFSGIPSGPRLQAPPSRRQSLADPLSASSMSSFDDSRRRSRSSWDATPHDKAPYRDRSRERDRERSHDHDSDRGRDRGYGHHRRGSGRSRSPNDSRGKHHSYGSRDKGYDDRYRRDDSGRGRSRGGDDWRGSYRDKGWDRNYREHKGDRDDGWGAKKDMKDSGTSPAAK